MASGLMPSFSTMRGQLFCIYLDISGKKGNTFQLKPGRGVLMIAYLFHRQNPEYIFATSEISRDGARRCPFHGQDI